MSDQNQNKQDEGLEEAVIEENPVEGIAIIEAPTVEADTGEALDVVKVEPKVFRAIMVEGDVEIFTIESSLEFGGTLIEEEVEVA